jgi:hypothetical protein
MKIQILRDSKGEVIAIFERTPRELVVIEAEVAPDHKLEEREVPDDFIFSQDADAMFNRIRREA